MNDKCEKCGSEKLYILDKKPHLQLRCKECNSWVTFIKKQDLTFYMKIKGFPKISAKEEE